MPESEGKDLGATRTPEKPKKPKMADWADDDSEYDEEDEEEEFNYDKQQDDEEGPCEDDHVKVGALSYKGRDGQRSHRKAHQYDNEQASQENAGDDLQFLHQQINQTNDDGPNRSRGQEEFKAAEMEDEGHQRSEHQDDQEY